MGPSAWHDLLLNLKLQLLGLPYLAKWGLLTFAGILILREAITAGWNRHQRRKGVTGPGATPAMLPTETAQANRPAALPAPDPFAASRAPVDTLDSVRVRTPPAGRDRR